MQYVVIAEHQPEFCPTSNAKIRELMKQGAKGIPDLAKRLGVKIITLNVYGKIHATWSLEEALAKAETLPTMF